MAHERSGTHTTQFLFRVFRHLPFRRFGFAPLGSRTAPFPFRRSPLRPPSAIRAGHISRRAKAVEHVAQLFRHDLARDLGHALAEGDPTPLGVALYRISTLVVRGHILCAIARQGADKPVLTGKIVAAIMQVHAVAMPRQGDIAAMGIHARRRQHMGAVHRHALRLVDRRGIAVVDPVVILEVEANGSAVVGLNGHGLRADLFDGPERAVPYAEASFVLQEHDAIPAGEVAVAALDRHTHLIAEIAGGAHPHPRSLVEHAHLVIGMGEDDPAPVR